MNAMKEIVQFASPASVIGVLFWGWWEVTDVLLWETPRKVLSFVYGPKESTTGPGKPGDYLQPVVTVLDDLKTTTKQPWSRDSEGYPLQGVDEVPDTEPDKPSGEVSN